VTAIPLRFLYLHGFASGPRSKKGLALAEHFAGLGVSIEQLDLRVPSLEHLRTSVAVETTRAAVGGPRDRAVLFGSSLGGLVACRAAEQDPRVCALVLLAPAFRMAERWRARLGDEGMRRWRESGWLAIDDHATGQRARVDHGFYEDAERLEAAGDGWPDVRVPVLIIHGRSDEVVDIELSRAWAAGKRHVRLVEVDDTHELIASLPRIAGEARRFLMPIIG
jgi:pimeloyl-ACP methyl ester carboxylesterase